eukprot:g2244.t1
MTPNYGGHGSDQCFCKEMYGEVVPWGCKWFQLWRQHIETAVEREQQLRVFFWEGQRGKGKISSWDECAQAAKKRKSYARQQSLFFRSLSKKQMLPGSFSTEAGSSKLFPRTERSEMDDEKERLFVASLSAEDRQYCESCIGLGNSQKAEVAWLEKRYQETGNAGFKYEEVDVREFFAVQESTLTRLLPAFGSGEDSPHSQQHPPSPSPDRDRDR